MLNTIAGYLQHYWGTTLHKVWVFYYLSKVICRLCWRALVHDLSKYYPSEASGFAKVIGRLKGSTYGTAEYKANLDRIRPVITLHQQRNRHHPEFYKRGLTGMALVDLVEMICDWEAAVRRHEDGNILDSMALNRARFDMADQLYAILMNTVK